MTPSFRGRMATMLPGVRPIICRASSPTASTWLVDSSTATTDGSLTTMPLPRMKISTLAVPRSIPISRPNTVPPLSVRTVLGEVRKVLATCSTTSCGFLLFSTDSGASRAGVSRRPLLVPAVLAPGGLAAPDLPLGLVQDQNALHLASQVFADPGEPLRHVFMHRALADAENGGRLTHRRPSLDDVSADVDHPFPDVISHRSAPPPGVAKGYGRRRHNMSALST